MLPLIRVLAAAGVLYGTTSRQIEIFPDLSPYDERSLSHPYNPGPKIIIAPVPAKVRNHKNLHLPDPTCLAGCYPGKSKME
jgi:hypothetical protein